MGWIIDTLKEIPLSTVLREKLKDYEKKHEELEVEIIKLKDENTKLIGEKQKLISRLKELTDTSELDENEEKILTLLSHHKDLTADVIAYSLGLSLTKTEYYLEKMKSNKYIYSHDYYTDTPSQYYLIQKGREYLIKKNLIE